MTDPTPVPTPPAAPAPAPDPVPPLNTAIPVPQPPPAAATPPWGSEENFNAEKAWELIQNLRKEKTPAVPADTSALQQQVAALQATTDARNKALAEAMGLAETPKPEDLAETVKNLQKQFEDSQREAARLRIAANPGVDAEGKSLPSIPAEYHNLLTETDPEKLKSQAEMVARLVAANAAAAAPPAFLPNPGQGQGGAPASPEAIADAEYRKYHPLPSRK